jgi:hypothetical protein
MAKTIKPKTKKEIEKALYSKLGKLGGPARAKSLTAKRRKSIARKASLTRWGKIKTTAKQN